MKFYARKGDAYQIRHLQHYAEDAQGILDFNFRLESLKSD